MAVLKNWNFFFLQIELPHPTEEARARILQIHSRKMNVDMEDVNFDELARCTDDFNGAQLKAVCIIDLCFHFYFVYLKVIVGLCGSWYVGLTS
jgi:ATP-dependent Zn protease